MAVSLYQLVKRQASALDEAAFVRRYDGWYFLSLTPAAEQDRIPFVTQVRRTPVTDTSATGPLPEHPTASDWLWKVEKDREGAWKGRISVGRANNNDLVIRHDTVSKLHAHFHAEGADPDGLGAPERFLLADAESSNGTYVNDRRLRPLTPEPINNRDRIAFGGVVGLFLDAASLHGELNAMDFF